MKAPRTIILEQWEVKGFYPHVPHLGNSMETGGPLMGVTNWIPAQVPGCVHDDLYRAGWIEDPYFAMNSLKCEWIEHRWWMYRTSFMLVLQANEHAHLTLRGLDYKGHIYFNNSYLGFLEGMFEPITFDITKYVKPERNELIVLLEHVPDEMGQIGYTSKTTTQKSRFAYKWDFSTRMVPTGLWDDVLVSVTKGARIRDVHLRHDIHSDIGILSVHVNAEAEQAAVVACKISIYDENRLLANTTVPMILNGGDLSCECRVQVDQVKLWFPNGSGEQALYRVKIELQLEGGEISDEWEGRTGFRQLEWLLNEDAPEGALPYTLRINGQRVYIKGVNLTPLDVLYGTVRRERYERIVRWMKRANINLVRVWGGGLIEKEVFYECCDEAGILVWQDFIQSSSGIDNIPSNHERFLALLERTAISALKTKRNHASLACWSGGNELMDASGVPITAEDANIAMLKRLVEQYDPDRYFLPTSASGPNEFLQIEQPGRNHDVHGPWKYGGVSGHYKMFNESDSLLHGEFGADGCCSYVSMEQFLPRQDLVVAAMEDNDVRRHHGEWWCTLARDTGLFGAFSTLPQFIRASQWTQAEGIRYGLEANRRRKFRNSGSIVWQFNEPFPNISCTSLIDYYGRPKMAYYRVRQAYSPKHISLRYDGLIYRPGETFGADVYVHNSQATAEMSWNAACIDAQGALLWEEHGNIIAPHGKSIKAGSIEIQFPKLNDDIFAVRLQVDTQEPQIYLFSTADTTPFASLQHSPKTSLRWTLQEQSEREGQRYEAYDVENIGDAIAWYVEGQTDGGHTPVFSPQQFAVLMPGERITFELFYDASGEREHISVFTCWNERDENACNE